MKPKRKPSKPRTVATLTIHGAGEMTQKGREWVADWLMDHANHVSWEGHNYSPRFRARYIVGGK